MLIRSELEDDKFELPDDYGWGASVASLETIHVPGRHLEIFSTAHAPVIAAAISRMLNPSSSP